MSCCRAKILLEARQDVLGLGTPLAHTGIYYHLRCPRKFKVCTRLEDMAQDLWEIYALLKWQINMLVQAKHPGHLNWHYINT